MTKLQLIEKWLFPLQPKVELENEPISNKRFIFMVTVGIAFIVLMEKLLN